MGADALPKQVIPTNCTQKQRTQDPPHPPIARSVETNKRFPWGGGRGRMEWNGRVIQHPYKINKSRSSLFPFPGLHKIHDCSHHAVSPRHDKNQQLQKIQKPRPSHPIAIAHCYQSSMIGGKSLPTSGTMFATCEHPRSPRYPSTYSSKRYRGCAGNVALVSS